MADYSPPTTGNIPFSFTTGGYTSPFAKGVQFSFSNIKSAMSTLSAAVNVIQQPDYGDLQNTTYTYLKYCDRYIVGYNAHGVQVLRKCYYGGIRDLGATIQAQPYVDLPGYIKITKSGQADLGGFIIGGEITDDRDLPATIGGHLPGDLPGFIHGWQEAYLPAQIRGLIYANLPGYVNPVPPEDLPAYLKVWPQEDLPGSIYGWQTADLPASMNIIFSRDLPAHIGTHPPANLGVILRSWVREAYADLGANVFSYDYNDLPSEIRGTEFADLPAYIFAIRPRNLPASIHGWVELDFPASINGLPWPYDLPASIVGRSYWRHLPAYIKAVEAENIGADLPASLQGYGASDLSARVESIYAPDLTAYINPQGYSAGLPASINPKMIRLTAVLSVITMEHKDLSATISVPCFYSDLRDLPAYISLIYKGDLSAVIRGVDPNQAHSDLGAKIGYAADYTVVDKLPLNLTIVPLGYRVEDKHPLYLNIYRYAENLVASITGEYMTSDLGAAITGLELTPYDFDTTRNRARVYKLIRNLLSDYEDVDISFQSIVHDYMYTSEGNVAAKLNKYEHFITKVASYYSPETAARLGRKLHKIKKLYDLRKFSSIDEAMRAAIDYVTSYPSEDISATITAKGRFENLSAYLQPKYTVSTSIDLNTEITGTQTYPVSAVVSFTDDGIGYLNF